ncbi:hypothetical protein ACIRQF_08430 [Streptomyces sp. NPDC101191]|uniref:hypothetical protein n=1 Tax=Streptomyces sp. NPDC101191 TaxID=3366126 RepID=UPI0038241FC4
MTVDDNEVRAGNAAGRAVSAISLPTVAWQQAGGEPEEGPEGEPQGNPDGKPAGKAEPKPRGESEGKPVEGAVAAVPAPEAATEPAPSAVPSGAAPAVPAADGETGSGTGTDSGADAGTDSGTDAGTDIGTDSGTDRGTDSDDEDTPDGAPGSGAHGTQAASDADGLAAEAAAAGAAPAARPESRPARRLSKPMIAAAATSGVVLMGVPLLLSQLGGGGSGPDPVPPRPTGYNQADGGPGGFVPRADAPEKGSSLPGAVRPGVTAGTGKGSSVAGKGPLAPGVAGVGAGIGAGVGVGAPAGPTPTSVARGTTPTAPRENTGTPRKPATQAPPAPPAKPQYSAVSGPNCAGTGASFTYSGWYTDGKEGWQKYGSGGYAGGGCNGSFFSLPMSGKAGSDAGNALRWTFRTGAVTSGTCQVSVHIPSSTDIKAVGGKPSYYTVHAGATGNDPILRSFTVDQQSLRGQWVSAGGVRVTGGVLTVKLHDRGLDSSGSRNTYAHHAGDAARVQCTSA